MTIQHILKLATVMCRINYQNKSKGFTLIELAMVLLIIGLLLGGLLMPLATQIEQRDRQLVKQELEDIKQALLGYAVINGRLPCPSFETDPSSDDYGMPVAMGSATCGQDGILPWKVLGVSETDPWGSARTSSNSLWTGYWHYRVREEYTDMLDQDTHFDTAMPGGPADELVVYHEDVSNKLTATGNDSPILIVYSSGPDGIPDTGNIDSAIYDPANAPSDPGDTEFQGGIPYAGFDDITTWMTRPLLLSTMLAARVLPDTP